MFLLLSADIARERKEHEIANEKQERAKENLAQKLAQTEKDLQLALKQEQQAHEEDCERLTKEKVGCVFVCGGVVEYCVCRRGGGSLQTGATDL